MRMLLRDYVEKLLYKCIRHGTESMGIRWNNIEWHTDKGIRYLRLWVDGKTGSRRRGTVKSLLHSDTLTFDQALQGFGGVGLMVNSFT